MRYERRARNRLETCALVSPVGRRLEVISYSLSGTELELFDKLRNSAQAQAQAQAQALALTLTLAGLTRQSSNDSRNARGAARLVNTRQESQML